MGEGTRYHSPTRAHQARQNRRAVLDAAHDLFVEQGFGATTIEQIATRAGVSKPTVFNAVGNKVEVFRTVRQEAVSGDDPSQELAAATTASEAVAVVADHITAVCRRYQGIHAALGGAAGTDAAMADLYDEAERRRHRVAGLLLAGLERHARTRGPRERAQDRLWSLMAPDNYARLVGRRRWSQRAYRDWLTEEICALLV